MEADYQVLLDDEREATLHVNLTDEGLIVDLYDTSGQWLDTWARTAQEFLEQYFEGR